MGQSGVGLRSHSSDQRNYQECPISIDLTHHFYFQIDGSIDPNFDSKRLPVHYQVLSMCDLIDPSYGANNPELLAYLYKYLPIFLMNPTPPCRDPIR